MVASDLVWAHIALVHAITTTVTSCSNCPDVFRKQFYCNQLLLAFDILIPPLWWSLSLEGWGTMYEIEFCFRAGIPQSLNLYMLSSCESLCQPTQYSFNLLMLLLNSLFFLAPYYIQSLPQHWMIRVPHRLLCPTYFPRVQFRLLQAHINDFPVLMRKGWLWACLAEYVLVSHTGASGIYILMCRYRYTCCFVSFCTLV